MPIWSQTEIQVQDEYQNVKIDSVEISLEEYVNAIADRYEDPLAYANSIKNSNGRIWLRYQIPTLNKKKQSFSAAIPHAMDRGLEELPITSGTSITGLNLTTEGSVSGLYHIPPDVHGAAGTTHVGYVVNSSIDFYNKAGVGVSGYPESLADFFSPLSPETLTFDPKILWDQYENRWVVVTLERKVSNNRSKIFLAVSATANPAGTWYYQAIDAVQTFGGDLSWFDYPGFAIDEEAIYITGNYFSFAGFYKESQVLIIDKGTSGGIYAGTVLADDNPANSGGVFTFYNPALEAAAGVNMTMQPTHTFGSMGGGVDNYLIGYSGIEGGVNELLQVFSITNPLSSPSFSQSYISLGDIDDIPINAGLSDIPQNGGIDIESNDPRTLNAQWANDALWTCFNMERVSGINAGQVGAYFVKLNTAGGLTVDQQGEVDGEDIAVGMETWNPAICIDGSDNAAMVFSACNGNNFASSYVASIDGNNGSVGQSTLLAAGTDTYVRTFGSGSNRWGDYAGITVDPTDGDIWAFSQTAINSGTVSGGEDGRWGVFIEEFQSLSLPMDLIEFGANLNNNEVYFNWLTMNEYNCAGYEIQYFDDAEWLTIHEESCNNLMQRNSYSASIELNDFGRYQFRLKQVDFDQKVTYSDIISLVYRDSSDAQELEIYPNPFYSELQLKISSNWIQNSILELLDSSGKIVLRKEIALLKGENNETVDLSNIGVGMYTLRLSHSKGIVHQKVLKME